MANQMIQLTSAIDLAGIVSRLKSKGLNVEEDALKVIVHEIFLEGAGALQKAFPFLAPLLLPLLTPLEAAVQKEVDKLDGEVG